MKRLIARIIGKLLAVAMLGITIEATRVIKKAPVCHFKSAEFVGEFTSLWQHTYMYQCKECKKRIGISSNKESEFKHTCSNCLDNPKKYTNSWDKLTDKIIRDSL